MTLPTRMRVGLTGLAAMALLSVTPAASSDQVHDDTIWVEPGTGTISAAVAGAESGDTLRLREGIYVDAVSFGSKAINVIGAGQGRSIIKLPAVLPPPDPNDFCRGPGGVAAGLCWIAPDGPVKVRHLTTVGHAIGILGFGMDGMDVRHTTGRDHDEYGLTAFESHGLRFVHNIERGDGGEAGIYVGDTADASARVAHNVSTGWAFGVFFRDARHGTATENRLARNCAGALVLDTGPNGVQTDPDSGEQFTNYEAGAWRLEENRAVRNTRFCAGEDEPSVGGHGILVVGADRVKIEDNTIRRNNPPAGGESIFPSSGVTIASGEVAGSDPPERVEVEDNEFHNTLDIFWDGTGHHIEFEDNDCQTSVPDGLCSD